ncbi:putative Uncharacterized serine-rich protein C13G6.10c [Glarea lozoyensis 74030]|uniref:Putative Uncharacterized serine-rich protein C13G6.10c n=1 Tax=Glarea lozoyensis (strain ATCC 74030 / MF5533) TaxID=1104152 RepID=H0EFW3_GLAL7|nr:putative Uncharacterized serine-rich protein C13G6.10c [Glarea lozoyensis 74030]
MTVLFFKPVVVILLLSLLASVTSTPTAERRALKYPRLNPAPDSISNKTYPPRPHELPPFDPLKPKGGVSFTNTKWIKTFDRKFNGMPDGIEYTPMLWGAGPQHTTNWKVNAQNAINRGADYILGFNEPDVCGSGTSCISPKAAADAWRTHIQPFRDQAWLGSPAITAGGKEWLKSFLIECSDCDIDFCAWGWFETYMQSIKDVIGNRTIWVTEFNAGAFTQPKATEDQQITFLKNVIPWMDKTDWIERYAWFMAEPNFDGGSLTSSNGQPTKLDVLWNPHTLDRQAIWINIFR